MSIESAKFVSHSRDLYPAIPPVRSHKLRVHASGDIEAVCAKNTFIRAEGNCDIRTYNDETIGKRVVQDLTSLERYSIHVTAREDEVFVDAHFSFQ